MINALFMGGVADGKRMQVCNDVQRITVPEMPDIAGLAAMEMPPDVIPTFKETTYYRVDGIFLRDNAVFTPKMNPTIGDLMRMLLNGYRPEADPNAKQ